MKIASTLLTMMILILALLPSCTYEYVRPAISVTTPPKNKSAITTNHKAIQPRGYLVQTDEPAQAVVFKNNDQRETRVVGSLATVKY